MESFNTQLTKESGNPEKNFEEELIEERKRVAIANLDQEYKEVLGITLDAELAMKDIRLFSLRREYEDRRKSIDEIFEREKLKLEAIKMLKQDERKISAPSTITQEELKKRFKKEMEFLEEKRDKDISDFNRLYADVKDLESTDELLSKDVRKYGLWSQYERFRLGVKERFYTERNALLNNYVDDLSQLDITVAPTRKGELDFSAILNEMREFADAWKKERDVESPTKDQFALGGHLGSYVDRRLWLLKDLERGDWFGLYFNNWPMRYKGISSNEDLLKDIKDAKNAVGDDEFKVYVYLRTKKGYNKRDLTA